MAESIEELVVAARPEGLDETSEGFQQMESDLADASGQMGETTGDLSDMQSKWQGAMGAIVGGLAVASAGLMSQVPVIGEAMGGLGSIIDAVAFKMDGVLRPALQPLTNGFYDVSEAIFETDGVVGDLIGIVASLAAGIAIALPIIAAIGSQLGIWASTGAGVLAMLGSMAGMVKTAAVAIGGLIAGLGALTAGILLVVAAIAAFALAYHTNFMGVRDKTDAIVGDILGFFDTLVSDGIQYAENLWDGVVGWFESIGEDAGNALSNLAEDAKDYGASLISNLVQGIKNAIPDLSGILNQDIVAGVSISDAISTVDGVVSSGGGGGSSGQSSEFSARRNTTANVYLDGRDVSDRTGRYRSDTTSRRGRHG